MRKTMLALSAVAMVAPTLVVTTPAEARRHYAYKEWRGKDGRIYCRRSNGTTGLIIGGVGGALLGGAVTHGAAGPIIGAGAGALLGRQIDRDNSRRRCR